MASTRKPWTNLELWTLLTIYKSDMEEGWDIRAATQMESTRNSRVERRPKGFYTADNCKEQLARIMAEPCPSDVPTGTEYNRTAIVDEWIKHYSKLEERLMAAWGHREKFTTEQLEAMLESIKKEEKEIYIWSSTQTSQHLHEPSPGRHSSSGPPDHKSSDLDTVQHSSDSCALKSPVADSCCETSGGRDMHPLNLENDQVEKMEVDGAAVSSELDTSMDSPSKDLLQGDHSSKRLRGRLSKKDSSTPPRESSPSIANNSEEAKSPTRSEILRSGGRNESTLSPVTPEKDAIQVVDSPAGRVRGARRPAPVDSPLLSKTSSSGRTNSGADLVDVKEGSRERDIAKRRLSTDVGAHLTLSPPPNLIVDESGGTATQTAVSIQPRLCPGYGGNIVASRKSSRHDRRSSNATNTVGSGLSRCDVAVETDPVKIDFDENVHCENDQNSRVVPWDDILNSNISRKSYRISFPEDRIQLFEVSYSDLSEEAWQGEKSSLSLHVCSPSKRMRREEKSGSVLTPKGRMMSTWNLLHEHRHSAIFLHPVTDRDAPGYSNIVNCSVDLTTLRKEIDGGTTLNPNMLLRKVFMMFTNAVMFNSTGHDVNFYAKEMCKDTVVECCFTKVIKAAQVMEITEITLKKKKKARVREKIGVLSDEKYFVQDEPQMNPQEWIPIRWGPGVRHEHLFESNNFASRAGEPAHRKENCESEQNGDDQERGGDQRAAEQRDAAAGTAIPF
uniref:Bromo domain-containing protein n=1 Tax=Angiostrongylus cantonensis TaxID=6313 RepID=A0A158P693_ANGCA